jgi:hypothetical protein
MDLQDFKASVQNEEAPAELSTGLQALWHDAKGNWDTAHTLSQDTPDPVGAWVHAYLHRVEGDESNAGHWYKRAGKDHSSADLAVEWEEIATALLTR